MQSNLCAVGVEGAVCMPSDVLQEAARAVSDPKTLEVLKKATRANIKDDPGEFVYSDNFSEIVVARPVVAPSPLPIDQKKHIFDRVSYSLDCDGNELCVMRAVSRLISKDKFRRIIAMNYKHAGPRGTEWLSNADIDKCMQHFMVAFSDFHAYRFNMLDFVEHPLGGIPAMLKKRPPHKIYQDTNGVKRRFGCAWNTDIAQGSGGLHWVSFFCDLSSDHEWTVEFFDSGADEYKQFTDYCMEVVANLQKIAPPDVNVVFVANNKLVHQHSSYECGAYTIYYIYSRLNGVSAKTFSEIPVPDSRIHQFRQFIFRPAISE